jgi:hypothetical protein
MNLLANTQTSQNFTKKKFFFTKLNRKIIELTEKTVAKRENLKKKFTAGANTLISLYPANLPPEAMCTTSTLQIDRRRPCV